MLNKLFWVQLTLFFLKITDFINWNWWLILFPLISWVFFIYCLYFVVLILYLIHSKGDIKEAWQLLITDLHLFLENNKDS
jgi:hypothetical protein